MNESFGANDNEQYQLFYNGKKLGVFSKSEIIQQFSEGIISEDAMIKINNSWITLANSSWDIYNYTSMDNDNYEAASGTVPENVPENVPETYSMVEEKIVICPHCWHKFEKSKINYISRHIELTGDPILGSEAQQRFLPTVFNEQGYAIDAYGLVCQDMACPNCHLRIPEAVTDITSSFFSIVGAPASGKSYYLTSMIWNLRKILAQQFDYTLSDTDVTFNLALNNYESILFLNHHNNEYVALPKTELQGKDFTSQIFLNGMNIDLPLPFIFTMTPLPSNQNFANSNEGLKNIIFYDNAGELFEPGRDQINNLGTRHLVYSDAISFLFDPIKDSRMVTLCNGNDPQVAHIDSGTNQLILLNEMLNRIRKYSGLKSNEKSQKPFVVIIPKYDAWKDVFPVDLEQTEFTYYNESEMKYYLDLATITNVSFIMRSELLRISPEIVATSEAFFSNVYFIPVSALGQIPEYDVEKNMIAIKPNNLNPIWAEVPALIQFWHAGLIDAVIPSSGYDVAVENYRFMGNSLIYNLPGTRERETVPMMYSGKVVYNTKINKYIKLPDPPETQVKQVKNPGEDAFWQQ